MKNNVSDSWVEDKEVAKLRWEYLLRSKEYKEFYIQHQNVDLSDFNNIFSMQNTALGSLFLHFGNIHSKSFDDYWEGKVENSKLNEWRKEILERFNSNVVEYDIGKDIDYVVTQYAQVYAGLKPSIEELKAGLMRLHKGRTEHFGRACFLIFTKDTIREVNDVTKDLAKILKKRVSRKRFIKKDLERYLKVYDMRTQEIPVTYRCIHEELYPRIPYAENVRRARINDFNRAKEIIRNVEKNERFYW